MVRFTRVAKAALAGAVLAAVLPIQALAEGNIRFGNGRLAVLPDQADPRAQAQVMQEAEPGFSRAMLPPVTPEESERAVRARVLPPGLITGDASLAVQMSTIPAAPAGPASITELARALKNDPDLIYEYVRNNIAYYLT